MKSYFYYLTIAGLSLFFFSCQKKDKIDGPSSGKIELRVEATSEDFLNNLVNGKMASDYSYTPAVETTVDFDKDHMLVAAVLPVSSMDGVGSKLLTSNRKIASTDNIDQGDVYRLLVYDDAGKFVAKRDYVRESEPDTEPLLLSRNTRYTFIAYSLNTTNLADLDPLLYVNEIQSPSDAVLESSSTISNTSIWGRGDSDLLFFQESRQTADNPDDFLRIRLKHKYNLLQTEIDVTESGYSIADLAANFSIKQNSVRFYFAGNTVRYNRPSSVSLGEFTYSTVGGIQKSKAISDPIIINERSGESLLNITSLKIGDISQAGTIMPFATRGVTLASGYKYKLLVKMVPKDSLYDINGVPVARINGLVWMRHNLGANQSTNPDIANTGNLGHYYQWGRKNSVADGLTNGGPGGVTGWVSNTTVTPALLAGWTRPKEAVNGALRGSEDPCPTGFRLPITSEFQELINATTLSGYVGSQGSNTYAMQLKSKRKANVLLTFPTQGYINVAGYDTGLSWSPSSYSSIIGRGSRAYLKGSTYSTKTLNNHTTLMYELLQNSSSTGGASIYGLNGSGHNSTGNPAIAHPVRCIAEGLNSRIELNDRVIDTNNGGTVGF